MKHPSFLLVALVGVAACTRGDPLQPDGQAFRVLPSEASAAAATAPVTATFTLDFGGVIIPADEKATGKVLHWFGGEFPWFVDGDLTGYFIALGRAHSLYDQDGNAISANGEFAMDLTAPCVGRFEGRWHGALNPDFIGMFEGSGLGGCAGLRLRGDFWPVTSGNNFVLQFEGTLHSPQP